MRTASYVTLAVFLSSSITAAAADLRAYGREELVASRAPPYVTADRVVVLDPSYTPGNPRCFLKREVVLIRETPVLAYRPVCN